MKSKLKTNNKFFYIAQTFLILLVFALGASLLMPNMKVYADDPVFTYEFDLKVKMLGPGAEDLALTGGELERSFTIKVTGTEGTEGSPSGGLTFSYLTELETWESLDLAGLQGLLDDLNLDKTVFENIPRTGGDGEEYDPLILDNFSYGDDEMDEWAVDILSDLYWEARDAEGTVYITANYVESDWIDVEIDIKLTAKSGGNTVGSSTVEDALIVSGIKGDNDLPITDDVYDLFEIAFSSEFQEIIANPATKFLVPGYTFNAWTGMVGSETLTISSEKKDIYEFYLTKLGEETTFDLNFLADFEINKYTITFNSNEGSPVDAIIQDYNTTVAKPADPTRAGYEFNGWFTDDKTFANEYAFTTMPENGASLYAKWEAIEYTVAFDKNDGEGTDMNDQEFVYGTAQELSQNTYTRTGYTFAGWNTQANGIDGTSYADKASVNNLTATAGETITLYAQWTANTNTAYKVEYYQQNITDNDYTLALTENLTGTTGETATVTDYENKYIGFTYQVTGSKLSGTIVADGTLVLKVYYDRNVYTVKFMNGTTEYDTQQIRHGGTATVPETNPTKEATAEYTYGFTGWTPTVPATITKAETFNAEYTQTAVKYTITFNTNGGNTITAKEIAFGTELTGDNAMPIPEKTGYTFMGWYSNEGLTTEFTATTMPANNVDLYAKWGGTITFKNGENVVKTEILATGTTGTTLEAIIPENPAPATGYEFKGWYVGETKIDSDYVVGGDVTANAKFEATAYTITYDLDGGTNGENPTTYTINDTVALQDPTKAGYTFEGWFTDSEFETAFTGITEGSTGNITVYAEWKIIEYTITYNLNGGTNHEDNPEIYTILTEDITLEDPTKAGYTFEGWFEDAEFNTEFGGIEQGTTGNITVYAEWEAITYTVKFNKNNDDATGTMTDKTGVVYGETLTITNEFVRAGYTFKGWALTPTGDVLTAIQLKTLTTTEGVTVTLYAIWEAEPVNNSYLYYIIGGGILLILLILGNLLSVRTKNKK